MTSEDTLRYAQSEEQDAKAIQQEIDKKQAEIALLQKDIDSRKQLISSLQPKLDQHVRDAEKLHQKASLERQNEERELEKQQGSGDDSLVRRGVKEAIKRSLF